MLWEAEGIYQKLKVFIDNHHRSRTSDLSHFRYLVGLAMPVHLDGHFEQAYGNWSEVRKSISQRGWIEVFVRWSFRMRFLRLTTDVDKREIFGESGRTLSPNLSQPRRFWVTNLHTFSLNFLKDYFQVHRN
jgi:hypothetical protein